MTNRAAKCGSILVLGGGIAGLQAARDAVDAGFRVYLVEREGELGGRMAALDKTFPTNDCAMCMLSPRLVEIANNPNVRIIKRAQVVSVDGEPGRFRVTVRRVGRTAAGPDAAAAETPVAEPEIARSARQAAEPEGAGGIPPTEPAPRAGGGLKPALAEACGLYDDCDQCPISCNRRLSRALDETIEVGAIILAAGLAPYRAERAGEYGYGRYANVVTSVEYEKMLLASGPTGGRIVRPSDGAAPKSIAFIQCVGSRSVTDAANPWCSGVCCMYTAKEAVITREHSPDTDIAVFFVDVRAHGKGFERYRDAAEKTHGVRYIRSMPSTVKELKRTGNLAVRYVDERDALKDEEFDLVVLAVGLEPAAGAAEAAKLLGVELNQWGFPRTPETSPVETSRRGILAAGTAVEPKDIPESVTAGSAAAAKAGEMLAAARWSRITRSDFPVEKDVAGQEKRIGVFVCHCGNNIARVIDVKAVTAYARGLPGVAVAVDARYACSGDGLDMIRRTIRDAGLNRVVVAACSPRTHEAIFRRTLCEEGLNPYLVELANIRDQCAWVHKSDPRAATDKARDLVRAAVARVALVEPLAEKRVPVTARALVIGGGAAGMTVALSLARQGFDVTLVEKEDALGGNLRDTSESVWGLDFQAYLAELTAAVASNPRIEILTGAAVASHSGFVGNFESAVTTPSGSRRVRHGVTIVATGAREYKADEYLYGAHARVMTQREFERELSSGSAAGRAGAGRDVVMIQCVGSRDDKRPYCSRVCCSRAVKNAIEIMRTRAGTSVYILHRGVRTYGFKEELYRRSREAGVRFIRYLPERKPEVAPDGDGLSVKVFDQDLQDEVTLAAGTVVLATGVVPNADAEDLGRLLRLHNSDDGFFLEAHVKLRPVDFLTDGIYLCGMAHGPKLFDESIAQALSAAGRAATVLAKETITVGGSVAVVDGDLCAACLACVRLCPYEVPVIREGKAEIEPAKCQGCGICASACPAKAIQLLHYTDAQVIAAASALARGEL